MENALSKDKNGQLKKIGILSLILILALTTFIVAETIKDSYNYTTKTITIKDSFLGIPTTKIADITLNTPLIYKVPVGYQKVAEFKVTNYEDYTNAISNMNFYDKNDNMKSIEKKFDYKVLVNKSKEVNDYELTKGCSYKDINNCVKIIGTHIEYYDEWMPLEKYDFVKGEVKTIGIFTQVNIGDNVEWIMDAYGKTINEFASYVQSSGTTTYMDIDGKNYTIITYTSNGTFNLTDASLNISVLVVGGGAVGGTNANGIGGGGGAGGLVYYNSYSLLTGNYNVVVGEGGSATYPDENGADSSFATITSFGGGTGENFSVTNENGFNGGCGGGGGASESIITIGGNGSQGYNGGRGGGLYGTNWLGGGGGGTGTNGGDVTDTTGGMGGNGTLINIYNGTDLWYGGGGGGGEYTHTAGIGGFGGGGDGDGGNAVANTGGGGGGATFHGAGGLGGSGIIIIRFLTATPDTTPPTFTTIPSNVSGTYGSANVNAQFVATDETSFSMIFINDTSNFTMNNATKTLTNNSPLFVGSYALNVTINDSSNNINWTIFTVVVNKIAVIPYLKLNDVASDLIVTYPATVNASSSCDYGTVATLTRNSTNIISQNNVNTTIAANYYEYEVYCSGDANHSAASLDRYVTINKVALTGSLTSTKGWTYNYDNLATTIAFSESNAGDSDVTYEIYRDGVNKSTGETVNLPANTYAYVLNSTGGENYSTSTSIHSNNLVINKNSENCQVLFNTTSPLEYPNHFNVWANCTTAFVLARNGTTITNNSEQALAVGAYNFSVSRNDTANYTNIFSQSGFVINSSIDPINILSPTQNGNYSLSLIWINATNSSVINNWTINYNGTNVTLPSINRTWTVEEGTFNLKLWANDTTGITTLNDSINFTVDRTAPIFTTNVYEGQEIGKLSWESYISYGIGYTITDLHLNSSYYKFTFANGTIWENWSAGSLGNFAFNMVDYGVYTFYMNATDYAGNFYEKIVHFSLGLVSGNSGSGAGSLGLLSTASLVSENQNATTVASSATPTLSLFIQKYWWALIILVFIVLIASDSVQKRRK